MSDNKNTALDIAGSIIATCVFAGFWVATIGTVGLIERGCKTEEQKQGIESIVQEEKETVLTQISDIQPRIAAYTIISEGKTQEKIAVFNYVTISGGDVKEATLILPSESIESLKKYTPARITYKKLNGGMVMLQNLISQHYDQNGISTKPEIIKADGIIEQSGIQYIEEGK